MLDELCIANIRLILCSKPSKFWTAILHNPIRSSWISYCNASSILHTFSHKWELLLPLMPHHTIVHLCLCPRHGYHMLCLHHSPPLHISAPPSSCPSRPPLLPSHGTTSAKPLPSMAPWHCISSRRWALLVLVAAHSPAASMVCICSLHFHLIL